MSDYRWSLGTLIGLPVAAVLALICVGWVLWMLFLWRLERKDPRPYNEGPGFFLGMTAVGVLCLLAVVGLTAWLMWPFKAEYHQWQNTTGVVEAIDSRLLSGSDGSGPTERFVVTFDDGRQRSCDDTRCAQVEAGDELTLACKRAWQWSGTHGYDCSYISHEVSR